MIELRRLKNAASAPPHGAPWILIEKRENLYFLSADSKEGGVDASLSWRTGTDSARIAIKSAEAWADLLAATTVYVRDEH
jgi:hypothetical protein